MEQAFPPAESQHIALVNRMRAKTARECGLERPCF